LATTNAPNRSGRAGRTASNFYELPDNLLVSAETEDDTIALSAEARAPGRDVSGEPPWRDAIGRGLLWVWALTNQQGYEDGCQVDFGGVDRNDRPDRLCIQLIVAASTLHISTMSAWT
jgi:hypothetical protein